MNIKIIGLPLTLHKLNLEFVCSQNILKFKFLLKSRKYLLLGCLVGMIFMLGCCPTSNNYNPWNIADSDTLCLEPPDRGELYSIPGMLFKAIDPRYIANVYGFTKSEISNGEPVSKHKTFGLITFDHYYKPNYDERNQQPLTTLNVRKNWNYYINDNLAWYYSRVLVSALHLQAFERVEYTPSDTLKALLARLPIGIYSSDGSIRVYTRVISQSIIDDSKTLYLLNGLVVTRKIYEAINPVFIRSLIRITKQEELEQYGQPKNVKEIVKVDLFTYNELIKNPTSLGDIIFRTNDGRDYEVFLVDNIQINRGIYDALNHYFFKEFYETTEFDSESFVSYREKFNYIKIDWSQTKIITIISL